MSKLKVGDRVFVQAVVIDHASDLNDSPRYEVEFSENKASRWFPEGDLKQATAPNRESDSPGIQGLAQLGRNAIDRVSELERERDETIRKLRDPVAVHIAMLRGEIAIPPLAELLHVYGATFSDLDAANIELAKARAEATKWERLHDELYAEIASEHRRDEYGETETAAECVGRIIREREQLRAQLDEYERAPQPPHVDPDWLANVIRTVDGDHAMGAGTLAEKIADAINGRTK